MVQDAGSVDALLESFVPFSRAAGAALNLEKSHLLVGEGAVGRPDNWGMTKVTAPIKILRVYMGQDGRAASESTWR